MKKHLLLLLPALALMACGGGSQGNGSDQNTDSTTAAVEEQQPSAPIFNYVEPQEEIAKIIWQKIQDTYPDVKKQVAAAKKWQMNEELGNYYNGASQKERYPQKTRMIFYNVIDGAEGSWDDLVYYKLQCYQNNDGSWTALFYDYENNYEEGASLRSFLYKDGALTDNSAQTDIPKTYDLKGNLDYTSTTLICDTIGVTVIPGNSWPVRYDWNGEKFVQDQKSAVLRNMIDYYGNIRWIRLNYEPKIEVWLSEEGCKLENNVLTKAGKKIADIEVTDNQITAINIVSPELGFAQKWDYSTDNWGSDRTKVYTSKPVAVGFPIKNVFDKPDDEPEYTTEKKDGYYVATRRTYRDKGNKRDVMISFYAKDENSNIEKIRLYNAPLQITLLSDIEGEESMPNEIKDLWKKFDAQYKITAGLGEFHNSWTSPRGFSARFYDNGKYTSTSPNQQIDIEFKWYAFKKSDGSYLILTQKNVDNIYILPDDERKGLKREFAQYLYKDGTFTQTEFDLPQTTAEDYQAGKKDKKIIPVGKEHIEKVGSSLTVTAPLYSWDDGCKPDIKIEFNGFILRAGTTTYQGYGEFPDDPSNSYWYTTNYEWDGDKFVYRNMYE